RLDCCVNLDMFCMCYSYIFFFQAPAPTELYTLSLHDALPIYARSDGRFWPPEKSLALGSRSPWWCELRSGANGRGSRFRNSHHQDRKSTRLNSSHDQNSYAVFCLKKKNRNKLCSHSYFNNMVH